MQPVVIKIGGSTLEEPEALKLLWRAVAAAAADGAAPVLVHGGGKAVDALLQRLGLPVERRAGLRVTPDEQIDIVSGVLAGALNKTLVGCLRREGARAVGICLGESGVLSTERMREPDLGRVGVPAASGGDGVLVQTLVREGYLPVVSSIGIDAEGQVLNVNADDAAAGLALAVRARALVLLTDVPGVRDETGQIAAQLTVTRVEALIASGVIAGGMIPKTRSASAVARRGVPVVILSGQTPDALLEWVVTGAGGTRIVLA